MLAPAITRIRVTSWVRLVVGLALQSQNTWLSAVKLTVPTLDVAVERSHFLPLRLLLILSCTIQVKPDKLLRSSRLDFP